MDILIYILIFVLGVSVMVTDKVSAMQLADKIRKVVGTCYKVSCMQRLACGGISTVMTVTPREEFSLYQVCIWRDILNEIVSSAGYTLRGDDEQYIIYSPVE